MILLQGQGLAYVCGWSPIWEYYDSYSRKFTHCYRWAKWYWKIYAIKNVGWNRRAFSWRCVKEERPLDWLLRPIRAIQSSRTVWEEMVHLFEDVETFEETSAKAAEQLGDPDLLKWPRGVRTRLKTIRPATRRIEPKNALWLRVWNSHRASWIPFLSRRLRPTDTSTLWRSTHSFGTSAYFIRKARLTHLRRTDQPLDIETLTWLEDYLRSSNSACHRIPRPILLDRVCNEVYKEISHKACE